MTAKAAVIGWPINHSKSPLIHNHWLSRYSIKGTYEAIAVAPVALKESIQRLVDAGYRGFNVTVPHKQAILEHMDFVRPDAERIGAVNTVVVGADGTLEGRNTDAFGFIANLKLSAPDFNFRGGSAVVIGAGGAARAVIYALQKEGVDTIRIINRTLENARALAAEFPPCEAIAWDHLPDMTKDASLIINTTTLGMTGQAPLELDFARVKPTALVHDIVYAPLETPLLRAARAAGNPTVTGIGMLLHQARPAFEAWFGVMPDVDPDLVKMVLA